MCSCKNVLKPVVCSDFIRYLKRSTICGGSVWAEDTRKHFLVSREKHALESATVYLKKYVWLGNKMSRGFAIWKVVSRVACIREFTLRALVRAACPGHLLFQGTLPESLLPIVTPTTLDLHWSIRSVIVRSCHIYYLEYISLSLILSCASSASNHILTIRKRWCSVCLFPYHISPL
jgi:hypothetical protein